MQRTLFIFELDVGRKLCTTFPDFDMPAHVTKPMYEKNYINYKHDK